MDEVNFQSSFSSAVAEPKPKSKPRKRLPPFSLRLSETEKQALEVKAGSKPIGRYVKDVIFSDIVVPGQSRARRSHYDDAATAQLTAKLGQSRISSNLNQLAKLANMGNLPVDDERGGSVCLNRFRFLDKWISALFVMPQSGLIATH